uniref:CSON006627 protein n=1 Tax=Culicoides sonorensis TaxID=179676 RepID=A0A336KAT1_CULSO
MNFIAADIYLTVHSDHYRLEVVFKRIIEVFVDCQKVFPDFIAFLWHRIVMEVYKLCCYCINLNESSNLFNVVLNYTLGITRDYDYVKCCVLQFPSTSGEVLDVV